MVKSIKSKSGKTKRRKSKSGKGSGFEREISVQLSKWWSNGERDDIFWRTAGSGARATVRGKFAKSTYGQAGDIGAIDPIGTPLTGLILLELKRGYSGKSLIDLVESPQSESARTYCQWILKAKRLAIQQDIPFWSLIIKRNHRDTLIVFPEDLFCELGLSFYLKRTPYGKIVFKHKMMRSALPCYFMSLQEFLKNVNPDTIANTHKLYLGREK